MKTIEQVTEYVRWAINSFVDDPADSAFQRGYKAAMEEVLEEIVRDEDYGKPLHEMTAAEAIAYRLATKEG